MGPVEHPPHGEPLQRCPQVLPELPHEEGTVAALEEHLVVEADFHQELRPHVLGGALVDAGHDRASAEAAPWQDIRSWQQSEPCWAASARMSGWAQRQST